MKTEIYSLILLAFLYLGSSPQAQQPAQVQNQTPATDQASVTPPQPIQDLQLLIGKQVIVQRAPLCQPGTFEVVLTYAGKKAKVVSLKPVAMPGLSKSAMNKLPPATRAMIEDAQKSATILLEFEDGTRLDSCAPIGPSRLADFLEPAPGQILSMNQGPSSALSSSALSTAQPVISSKFSLVSDSDANDAIERARGKRHDIGLTLNDKQMSLVSGLACDTCGTSGYKIHIFTAENWIELQASRAFKEMLPFTLADVTPEMRSPYLRVLALPSTADYITGAGLSMASSVHRVVLSDTNRTETVQPLENTNSTVERNSALRSVGYSSAEAIFLMDDVDRIRGKDTNGEFFVVVVGDNQNKFFKIKSKFFKQLGDKQ